MQDREMQRKALYDSLRQKAMSGDVDSGLLLQGMENDDASRRRSDVLGGMANRAADRQSDAELFEIFSKAASKAGSINGKEAGSGLEGLAQGQAKSDQQRLNVLADSAGAQDKADQRRLQLAQYLQDKSRDDEYKKLSLGQTAAFRKSDQDFKMAEAKREQANKDREFNLRSKELAQKGEQDKLNREKPNLAQTKQDQETTYRYNALMQNANDLKKLIDEKGTFEAVGPHNANLDSKIYQMAVDYAKLVDPDSVAREGEVAAAQKYMMTFRDMGGLSTKNETAKGQIDNYIKDLDKRLNARQMAKQGEFVAKAEDKKDTSGQAIASPGSPKPGELVDGYEFMGGDPSKPESWRKK